MKPSEKRSRKILNLLKQYDYGTKGFDKFIAEAPSKLRMNQLTLKEDIRRMDSEADHLRYINFAYKQGLNGVYIPGFFYTEEWLTSDGKIT